MSDGCQPAAGPVDRETRDAIVAPIRGVKEPPGRRDLDLSTGTAATEVVGQSGYRLERRQGPRRAVEVVRRYAASLFVGEVNNVNARMETEVPRSRPPSGVRVRGELGVRRPDFSLNLY